LDAEIQDPLDGWLNASGDDVQHLNEAAAQVDLTPELRRRWFGDSMLQQPVHIADLQRASIVDHCACSSHGPLHLAS
jgi:hypothetical protein